MMRIYNYRAKKEQMASDKEIAMIMSLTGVDESTASAAYLQTESIEDAVDRLIQKPVVSGDKYLPAKPNVKSGLTTEQEERCRKGRWLQDQVNVVFSVAHSKTRSPLDLSALEAEAVQEPPATVPASSPAEGQSDSASKTSPSPPQSEDLP
jgi:hypothetical protein